MIGPLRIRSLCAALLLGLASLSRARSLTGSRTLLVIEDDDTKVLFDAFIKDLEGRGFDTQIHSPKSETLKLFVHDERAFDNIILFPTKLKGLGPELVPSKFLDHASAGGNILILLSSDPESTISTTVNDLASQVDVLIPPKGFQVVNHFDLADNLDPEHSTLVLDLPKFGDNVKNYFTGDDASAKLLYRGAGLAIGNSPLVQPILTAPRLAYSYDAKESKAYAEDENVFAAGSQLVLVAGVQTRNNARITFVGGADLFSDSLMTKVAKNEKMSANRAFARDVSAWTFKETGVLKVDGIEHWGKEYGPDVVNGNVYRISSDVTFSIALSEYSYDHFEPFVVPASDSLQLEFTMLDPYYRIPLTPITPSDNAVTKLQPKNSTIYSTTFYTPDQHGIFTFHVNYKRPFISSVHEKNAVTLRHKAHNEWTRSWGISAAWPWVGGLWIVVVGWLAFVGVWLWSKPVPLAGEKGGKKKQ